MTQKNYVENYREDIYDKEKLVPDNEIPSDLKCFQTF